ncbi:oxysterol-binding protein [Chloropicon primus]|uniref:Oxysterol-binding protein n=1 Tax=Chloropicon primus TaxID=1764295 RepID=A0A5B8MK77_9CHLO|nr:oxysterol-binding protein [Chloropicon primus]UPQ98973.1 oxysterol-binding protein [Chloropicon primus]|eukprot:QDZ19762.1 oxysterol-binding protein [Chloropicon primus]
MDEGTSKSSGGGGYRYTTDEERQLLERQKKVIWSWLKKVGRNLISEGVNLTKVSLPVELFESKSFLERVCDSWSYLDLLERAAEATDPVERMRCLIAFAVSGLSLQVNPNKPFNPILGETYQGAYKNGMRVYCEQVSHHPPVSCWEVVDPKERFRFTGTGHITATTRANSVRACQKGDSSVFFRSDGATVSWNLPGLILKNVMFGERVLKYSGEMLFRDDKNGLECLVKVDPSEEKSMFSRMLSSKKKNSVTGTLDEVFGEIVDKDAKVLDRCEGSWLSHLDWGLNKGESNRYWTRDKSNCVYPAPQAGPLDSDCSFRIDMQALRRAETNPDDAELYAQCIQEAQDSKVHLENIQRSDAKLRKKGLAMASKDSSKDNNNV